MDRRPSKVEQVTERIAEMLFDFPDGDDNVWFWQEELGALASEGNLIGLQDLYDEVREQWQWL